MNINIPNYRYLIFHIKKLKIDSNNLITKLPGMKICSNKALLANIHNTDQIEKNLCVYYFQIQYEKRRFDTHAVLSTAMEDFEIPFYAFNTENRLFQV